MAIETSDDGARALTASFDYSAILWRLDRPGAPLSQRLIGHDGAVNDVGFLQEHAVSTGDDAALIVWDLTDGAILARFDTEPVKVFAPDVSPGGTRIATARWDGTVGLYAFDGTVLEETARLEGHDGPVNAVAFADDGATLFSAGVDGTIRLWDVADGAARRTVHEHGWAINTLAVIDEARIAFGAVDGTAAIVVLEDGALTPLGDRQRPVRSIKRRGDGETIAVADITGAIALYALDGSEIVAQRVAAGPVWDFAFVPGTDQVLHVGLDDFVSRWQVAPRQLGQVRGELPRRFQVAEDADGMDLGEIEFRRKCSVCHTLTPDGANRAGPTLYQLFGREVGTLPGYVYSDALREADFVWTEETVHRLFAEGPDHVLPGTKMPLQRLKSEERREALVRFLKENTGGLAGGG